MFWNNTSKSTTDISCHRQHSCPNNGANRHTREKVLSLEAPHKWSPVLTKCCKAIPYPFRITGAAIKGFDPLTTQGIWGSTMVLNGAWITFPKPHIMYLSLSMKWNYRRAFIYLGFHSHCSVWTSVSCSKIPFHHSTTYTGQCL